ncbi:MAG TPA: OmpH family outer membrane protein [Bacteroidia bacterium]|nr:OmpH family outer membrane protein [Bacteroidia bacterium]
MMNKLMVGLNAVLLLAVGFLFYKLYSNDALNQNKKESEAEPSTKSIAPARAAVQQISHNPTGKIAYVNIDRLNEESKEISDLVSETKRRKSAIEGNMEALNLKYQNKVEEFQLLQKGGIAPKSELEAKAREIQAIEQEAQNKQLQMDQLTEDIGHKNENFQRTVRAFLVKWNAGRFDFILSYSEAMPLLLLGNSSLEITNEVISELNKEYKARQSKP